MFPFPLRTAFDTLRAGVRKVLARHGVLARALRLLGWALLVAWLLFGALVLALRYLVLPNIDSLRPAIVARLQGDIGQPVEVARIDADWSGLRPRFHLAGVRIEDAQGRTGLSLERVDATMAWSSLLRFAPHFHRLEIRGPQLSLSRDPQGRLHVAGFAVDGNGEDDGAAIGWLMAQREVVIRDARVSWRDALRGAPELLLDKVDLRLLGRAGRYRFGLTARPPAALATTVDVRGELRGNDPLAPLSWSGDVYVNLERVDLGVLRSWADFPALQTGVGGVRAWLRVTEGRATNLLADLALRDAKARLGADLPSFSLRRLQGRMRMTRGEGSEEYAIEGLSLQTQEGIALAPMDVRLRRQAAGWGRPESGQFQASRLEIAALAHLAAYLPVDAAWRAQLADLAPQGEFEGVEASWVGTLPEVQGWAVSARFRNLGVRADGKQPGITGISGELKGDQARGSLHLEGMDVSLDMPAVFPVTPLRFARFNADLGWAPGDGGVCITLERSSFDNAELSGHAEGSYTTQPEGPGRIDLQAGLSRATGTAVWRYLPKVVNQGTRDWLQRNLIAGTATDARLRLQGDLKDFPFRDNKGGLFRVTAKVQDARLNFASDWPGIDEIFGTLLFEGQKMRIEASRGSILGVALSGVVAEVPELGAPEELMHIHGKAAGDTAGFLRFVSASPVAERIGHFSDEMRAEGQGRLDLNLTMPLSHVVDTRVKGNFTFSGNKLWLMPELPPLDTVAGSLRFSDSDLAIPEAQGSFLGAPVRVSAATAADGGVNFAVDGKFSALGARGVYSWPMLAHLSGVTPWHGDIQVRRQGTHLHFSSDLDGLASSLPGPLNKSAQGRLPLAVDLVFPGGSEDDVLEAQLGDAVKLVLARNRSQQKGWGTVRGGLAVGAPLRVVDGGVMVAAHFDRFELDAWQQAFDSGADSAGPGLPLAGVALQAGQLDAWGQSIKDFELRAVADPAGWKGRVRSSNADGEFDWRSAKEGAIKAHFKFVNLEADPDGPDTGAASSESDQPLRSLPALDISVERFRLRGIELGRLDLQARNQGGLWQLDRLRLANTDGNLSGTGQWRPGTAQRTKLDFALDTEDVGRFLKRLGLPDAVSQGQAKLSGALSWHGAPTRLDYPSLQGKMELETKGGQFRQLDPGVGRLLGVLSLQSLPRRISLDFRDVFSAGFAFDRISGSIDVDSGVMRTKDLEIRGPAARVFLKGSADLAKETQDLKVTVQPTLSESVAFGAVAGLINPVAGVVTYLAQKALSDPIEKLFSYEYAVTGSWDDPQVAKVGGGVLPGQGTSKGGDTGNK